jgi:hypothetical protein
MPTHTQILTTIADYVTNYMTTNYPALTFNYTGIMPPISDKEDYKHFPAGKYPCLGPAMTALPYYDQSINTLFKKMHVQLIFSSRVPGFDIVEMMEDLYEMTQIMETLAQQEARGNYYGLSASADRMDVHGLYIFPTFYTEVQQNRKAFSIAYLDLTFHFPGL